MMRTESYGVGALTSVFVTLHLLAECSEHPSDLVNLLEESCCAILLKVTEVTTEYEEVLGFCQ